MSMQVIRGTFNAMVTVLMAKFILNDVLHALELAEKEPLIYTTYHMCCPRREPWECKHEYRVSTHGDISQRWEYCPLCGHGAMFGEFVL